MNNWDFKHLHSAKYSKVSLPPCQGPLLCQDTVALQGMEVVQAPLHHPGTIKWSLKIISSQSWNGRRPVPEKPGLIKCKVKSSQNSICSTLWGVPFKRLKIFWVGSLIHTPSLYPSALRLMVVHMVVDVPVHDALAVGWQERTTHQCLYKYPLGVIWRKQGGVRSGLILSSLDDILIKWLT